MDRFSKRQEKIDQYRNQALIRYPALWSDMIAEWKMPDPKDLVWLMYSANYLFRTNDVRWAIDPLTMSWRVKAAPPVDGARDLTDLDFVLLTHEHEDHLDLELLSALRHMPIQWVVPEFMLSKVVGQAGLPREKIIVPSALCPLELNGIRILPFDGLHWEITPDGAKKGVSSVGYLIECNDKRWLFPGDTRSYNSDQLSDFKNADVVFAHLWLGRGSAFMDEPPFLDAFCRFFLKLNPRRLILTHLHEFGRDAGDYWDDVHVQSVRSKFREMSASLSVTSLKMGNGVFL